MTDDYSRVCPNCGNTIVYKNKYHALKRKKINNPCKSCILVERNKTIIRKQKDHPCWEGFKEIPLTWFNNYFSRPSCKIEGTVTIEQVYNLWIKQEKRCALSGRIIGFFDDLTKVRSSHTCSIDRINSDDGYHINNIQLVHKDINIIKLHFNNEYFISMCKKIYDKNCK